MIALQGFAATPKETVETGVNKVLATLTDAGFKAKSKDEQVSQLSEVISTIFDFNELSKRTLGREWKKMNAAQQKRICRVVQRTAPGGLCRQAYGLLGSKSNL